jgi:hypothetical protein
MASSSAHNIELAFLMHVGTVTNSCALGGPLSRMSMRALLPLLCSPVALEARYMHAAPQQASCVGFTD